MEWKLGVMTHACPSTQEAKAGGLQV
jgi:hypothetical protein